MHPFAAQMWRNPLVPAVAASPADQLWWGADPDVRLPGARLSFTAVLARALHTGEPGLPPVCTWWWAFSWGASPGGGGNECCWLPLGFWAGGRVCPAAGAALEPAAPVPLSSQGLLLGSGVVLIQVQQQQEHFTAPQASVEVSSLLAHCWCQPFQAARNLVSSLLGCTGTLDIWATAGLAQLGSALMGIFKSIFYRK